MLAVSGPILVTGTAGLVRQGQAYCMPNRVNRCYDPALKQNWQAIFEGPQDFTFRRGKIAELTLASYTMKMSLPFDAAISRAIWR